MPTAACQRHPLEPLSNTKPVCYCYFTCFHWFLSFAGQESQSIQEGIRPLELDNLCVNTDYTKNQLPDLGQALNNSLANSLA